MSIKLDQIKDPKLRKRIMEASNQENIVLGICTRCGNAGTYVQRLKPSVWLCRGCLESNNYANSSRSSLPDTKPQRDTAPALGRGGSKTHPKWTESEISILRAFYLNAPRDKDFSVAPLAEVLKRSINAIHVKAVRIGVGFERGRYPCAPPKPYVSQAKYTKEERSRVRSEHLVKRHATTPHPMLGRPVSQSTREKISKAGKGRKRTPESIMAQLKTRSSRGVLYPLYPHGSWKAGWREIGDKRIYARSRWEANYARYLEWLKSYKQIAEWEHEPWTFWFESIKRGCRSYLPDFRVTFNNGSVEFHETKGWMDARSSTKLKRMAKYYPDVIVRIIDGVWFKANRLRLRGLIPGWEDSKCS